MHSIINHSIYQITWLTFKLPVVTNLKLQIENYYITVDKEVIDTNKKEVKLIINNNKDLYQIHMDIYWQLHVCSAITNLTPVILMLTIITIHFMHRFFYHTSFYIEEIFSLYCQRASRASSSEEFLYSGNIFTLLPTSQPSVFRAKTLGWRGGRE